MSTVPTITPKTYDTFAIHQICAVSGWHAVYWNDDTQAHFCVPLPVLALVTRYVRQCGSGDILHQFGPDISDAERREVVGMDYSDCGFEVCEKTSNFCGLLLPERSLGDFEASVCSHGLAAVTP